MPSMLWCCCKIVLFYDILRFCLKLYTYSTYARYDRQYLGWFNKFLKAVWWEKNQNERKNVFIYRIILLTMSLKHSICILRTLRYGYALFDVVINTWISNWKYLVFWYLFFQFNIILFTFIVVVILNEFHVKLVFQVEICAQCTEIYSLDANYVIKVN